MQKRTLQKWLSHAWATTSPVLLLTPYNHMVRFGGESEHVEVEAELSRGYTQVPRMLGTYQAQYVQG